ncbi:uncharacterized protein LOC6537786 [Drosophila yakuba]|uniref:SAM domain-containing protein n=1 Tax=Drosophila yakuba TaxID=7245 RepID=B4PMD4_DROYA|nr:uncharacterized protein LOC6537786 [Drosophila yakuba]EDW98039.1 uncharacterized protein Dyak_GE10322 [Drosophila yakuba]
MCLHAVREWLVLLTMEKYAAKFLERGYDSISRCKLIIASDLVMMGVDNPAHRKLLLDGVQFLINAPEKFICTEPCELHNHVELKLDPDVEYASLKSLESLDFPKAPVANWLASPPKMYKRGLTWSFCDLNVKNVDQFTSDNVTSEIQTS